MTDPLDPPDAELRRYLAGLPAGRPPPGLEQRLLAAHRRQRRVRRIERLAALLLLGLLLPGLLAPGFAPPVNLAAVDPILLRAEIRALDRQLQAAYSGDGEPLQRDALWIARQAAAQQLSQSAQSDVATVMPVRL